MRLSGLNPEEIHEIMRQPEINKTNTMRKELMTAVYNATQASARPIVDIGMLIKKSFALKHKLFLIAFFLKFFFHDFISFLLFTNVL